MKVVKKDINMKFVKKWIDKGLNPILLSILNRRGIDSDIELYRFLNASGMGSMPSPFIFRDIEKAYERIEYSIKNNEKIVVFGDRDVDGVTSVHIITDFLEKIGASFDYFVPVGDEPYGVNPDKIKTWKGQYGLLITVDCGITNTSEVAYLKENGIDTIVIDHHHVHGNVPDAFCIINPKFQIDYHVTDIAACTVVFMFVLGWFFRKSEYYNKVYRVCFAGRDIRLKNLVLTDSEFDKDLTSFVEKKIGKYSDDEVAFEEMMNFVRSELFKSIPGFSKVFNDYVQFAALGTIADIMPLAGINRTVVALGIESIKKEPLPPVKLLLEKAQVDHFLISSTDIAWKVTPVLNSPGRMGDAVQAVEYLKKGTLELSDRILAMNDERKKLGEEAYNSFINSVNENALGFNDSINFFYSRTISRGVIGITANKIAEFTGRPAVVCAVDDEVTIGSMRGDTACHLVEFLEGASGILDEYGGHRSAAGFRFKTERLGEFEEFIKNNSHLLDKEKLGDDFSVIDAEIPSEYLSDSLYKDISVLEPYGESNEVPLLFTRGFRVDKYSFIGKDQNHLKVLLSCGNYTVSGLFWNKAEWFKSVHKDGLLYDAVYKMEINHFRGNVSIQLKIVEMEAVNNDGL